MSDFTTTIGLEVHCQLLTQAKMFCHCSTDYIGKEPNTLVCPVCLGLPGSLPVLNQKVVELALRAALALHCQILLREYFTVKIIFILIYPKDIKSLSMIYPSEWTDFWNFTAGELKRK